MYQVQKDLCIGCGTCVEACPEGAITLQEERAHIDLSLCTDCGVCHDVCPNEAIVRISEREEVTAVAKGAGVVGPRPAEAPSSEIITVRVPPPPAVEEPRPALAEAILPAVGATLAFIGRELGPRLLRLATEWIDDRLAQPAERERAATRRPATGRGRGAGRQQRRRRRGGRRRG